MYKWIVFMAGARSYHLCGYLTITAFDIFDKPCISDSNTKMAHVSMCYIHINTFIGNKGIKHSY